jgi:hypothetical protein
MIALYIGLALLSLTALIGSLDRWGSSKPAEPEPELEPDLAAPYREGLYAAMRLQVTANDLQQQMYAEALRQATGNQDTEA